MGAATRPLKILPYFTPQPPTKQCEDVRASRWLDRVTKIRDVRKWRACFPNARCANVVGRGDLVDADLASLSGVEEVHADLGGLWQITDAGLAHIRGAVRTLNMRGCAGITDAGLAHLAGIHTLNMWGCNAATIACAHARFPPPTEVVS